MWADSTVCQDANCTQPTGVRWYQFDVTGGNFPATPVQQQTWTNGGDGLYRFMPSIAVDNSGNTAIGYSVSSSSIFPGIRYAGRLAGDPPGNLGQGEATMFDGTGSQTSGPRWGDYSYLSIDPADNMCFWHVNEYLAAQRCELAQRIGKFDFEGGRANPTPSGTPSATPSATPTATPGSCSWAAGSDMPQVGARFVGVFFPANGKFYVMGGRDANDVEFTNPFEYDPAANTWTTKSATYPDANTNNMACSVLNDSGTDYIYCVGGSNFATQTTSGRVFRYDPIADSITTVASNWPPGDTGILPGGFTVFNNTLVILGGFDIPNGVGTDQIWQFTPNPAGWVQKSAVLPVPLGYIPTTTIGSLIYTGGGADITGGALTDTTNSFVYDPVADSIDTIADIPRPTSNTRAVNFCNQMYVLGGGFNTPSNEVDIYDPASNTWSLGIPFATAGRNFAADTDGTNNIWKAGGYADDGADENRHDGNLQLPGESLWRRLRLRRRQLQRQRLLLPPAPEGYSFTAAASHAAASALRPAFTVVSSGTRDHSRVPGTRTSLEEITPQRRKLPEDKPARRTCASAVISKLSLRRMDESQGRGGGVGRGRGFGTTRTGIVDWTLRNTPPPAVPAKA